MSEKEVIDGLVTRAIRAEEEVAKLRAEVARLEDAIQAMMALDACAFGDRRAYEEAIERIGGRALAAQPAEKPAQPAGGRAGE